MYSKVLSCVLTGIEAKHITVETDVAFGFPALNIVGLPDTAVRESKERIRAAITNSGFRFPDKRITVNLSPADIRKEGSHFDLPIAVCIMLSSGVTANENISETAFLGELNLDGSLNGVNGILPMLLGMKAEGIKEVVIPFANSKEAANVNNLKIYPVSNLKQLVKHIRRDNVIESLKYEPAPDLKVSDYADFSDVSGQEHVKRGFQIAAAAMHNVLLVGPPGSGKTMMAQRLPGIMPPLSDEEKTELTKIYSIGGLLSEKRPFVTERPFRTPDHTVTPAALLGGGMRPRAGEVSLAHLGVLFLDEAAEFSRAALESLRRPMEDEECTITRVYGSMTLPSKFLTVAAMNPCKCGYYGDGRRECTCSAGSIRRYRSRLSGPFLDRIDILLNVRSSSYEEINSQKKGVSSAELSLGVMRARKIQDKRFKNEDISYNSQMRPSHMKKYCNIDEDSEYLMKTAFDNLKLSVRAYNKILKVSRTVADIEGCEKIKKEHIAEAISYRCELENVG